MNRISVIVPTLRRPEGLARSLRSLLGQTGVEDELHEIVVVDNSPEASARDLVARISAGASLPIRYLHEPRPGVATARNAGVDAACGDLIAFLDDDQEAVPTWLADLLDAHRRFQADVTIGPIDARIPQEGAWAEAHFRELFSRKGPDLDQLIEDCRGAGNSLMTRATALPGRSPFSTDRDQGGGEDDVLFAELRAQGRRFTWATGGIVLEHPAPHRLTMTYAVRRAFAFGQGPSQTAVRRREWGTLAKWTVVGLGQAAIFGVLTAAFWMAGRKDWPRWLDRAVRGVGKVLWMSALEPRFYGEAEVARSSGLVPAMGS